MPNRPATPIPPLAVELTTTELTTLEAALEAYVEMLIDARHDPVHHDQQDADEIEAELAVVGCIAQGLGLVIAV